MSSGRSLSRRFPARVTYEDEEHLAFHGLSPQAPTIFLVVPKEPVMGLPEAEDSGESRLRHLMVVGKKRAAHLGMTNGFQMVVDEGPEGGRSVLSQTPVWLSVGLATWLRFLAPQELLRVYASPLNGFHLLPVNLAAVDA